MAWSGMSKTAFARGWVCASLMWIMSGKLKLPEQTWQVYILRLGIQTDHCKVKTLANVEVFP